MARVGLWGKRRDNLSMSKSWWTHNSKDMGLFGKKDNSVYFRWKAKTSAKTA